MATLARKKRTPDLKFTTLRNLGFHVAYRRDGVPTKYKFEVYDEADRGEAEKRYHKWVAAHLDGRELPPLKPSPIRQVAKSRTIQANIRPDSLAAVTADFIEYERSRIRPETGPRAKNTIERKQYNSREKWALDFLKFLNNRYGSGAVGRMTLADLKLTDVEKYNEWIVDGLAGDGKELSSSNCRKRMQIVRAIVNNAGREPFGFQVLKWNWDSRRVKHGKPDGVKLLPTVDQLKAILRKCNTTRTLQVWMGIGLGFTQADLDCAQAIHFDETSYDMRRSKTDRQHLRYGEMPPLVWKLLKEYLAENPRPAREPLFVTERGRNLVRNESDSIQQWWADLRESIGETKETLSGYSVLRHLGATEYGSRDNARLNEVRTWMGHAVSSVVVDRYMRPLAPEHKAVVQWTREALLTGTVDLD